MPSMAYIKERPRRNGGITYCVMWRAGGVSGGKQESENFDNETDATAFLGLVELAGQNWPDGWVRGKGFVETGPVAPADRPFTEWADRIISRLNGIEERTRADYHRDIRLHVADILVHTDPNTGQIETATVCNVQPDDIADWVRAEERGLPHPDDPNPRNPKKWLRKPAAPKSIANRHSLLYNLFQAAAEAKPVAMRPDNPCKGTNLPRTDDGIEDEMVFLEHNEWQRIRAELAEICDGDALDLADILIATGLRWGEATALQPQDITLSTNRLRVQRAWKRQDGGMFKLGPPKTKKARRSLVLDRETMKIVRRLMAGKAPDAFLLTSANGGPWRHSNFRYRRWAPALKAAQAKGLTKMPRIHDIRHTHVSWLIAAKIPLPAIQARLGHESITTTVDRYGHLVRELDSEIASALQAALSRDSAPGLHLVEAAR